MAYLPNINKVIKVLAKSPTLSRMFPSPSKFAQYYIEIAVNMTRGSSNRQYMVYWNATGHLSTEVSASVSMLVLRAVNLEMLFTLNF